MNTFQLEKQTPRFKFIFIIYMANFISLSEAEK